jgi:hypothetical protein
MRFKSVLVAAVVCALLAMTGTAFAQDPSGTVKQPKVGGETLNTGGNQPASFEGETDEGGGGTPVLPFTGADVTLFLVIGVAAIAAGAALVRRTGPKRIP